MLFLANAIAVEAQLSFQSGYFIKHDGQRTECQIRIRNFDWKDNPQSFEYRINETATAVEADLESIMELGLEGGAVFRRHEVYIDRSWQDVGRLDKERSPQFNSEKLFLRILVEGKAKLYQYDEGNLHRFFYSLEQIEPKQLVYKRYLTPNGEATYNEGYKQQLFNDLKCESIAKNEIEKLRYDAADFSQLFTQYNSCHGVETKTFADRKMEEAPVYITLRPGLTYNSLNIENISFAGGGRADMDNVLSYRIGLEIEFTLPFGQALWSLYTEPVYQAFSSQISSGSVSADFSLIDLHLGVRRYFPVSDQGKLYINASVVYGSSMSGSITIVGTKYGGSSTFSPAIAVGYRVKRLNAELNYGLPRDLMKGSSTYEAKYGGPSLVFGYRLR